MQGDCDDDADDIDDHHVDDHHVDDVDEHDHAGDWKDTAVEVWVLSWVT